MQPVGKGFHLAAAFLVDYLRVDLRSANISMSQHF